MVNLISFEIQCRCGWCQYISSRRNVVERHMKEKHHSKKPFDYVIREPEDHDAQKKSDEKPSEVRTCDLFYV